MFGIPFQITIFISLIEVEHPLKVSNKRTHIALSIFFFNGQKKYTIWFYIYDFYIYVKS